MSLPEILAAARPTDDGFRAEIPETWMQGRTSYGGLSAALAYSASVSDTGGACVYAGDTSPRPTSNEIAIRIDSHSTSRGCQCFSYLLLN